MKQLLVFMLCLCLFSQARSQGVTLLYVNNQGWDNSLSWIQIDAPAGQIPVQRVPTELDNVVFSQSMSGISNAWIIVQTLADSITVGINRTSGVRCKSMHISNTALSINSAQSNEIFPPVVVSTANGGFVLIDSNSSVMPAEFLLQGGDPNIYDLQLLDSEFGKILAHNRHSGSITLGSMGRMKMLNSRYGSFSFSWGGTGELYAENSIINVNSFVRGSLSKTTLLKTTVTDVGPSSSLSFGIGPNAEFNSSEVKVEAFSSLSFYTSGTVFNGDVSTLSPQSGLKLMQFDPTNPLPNIINGNINAFLQGVDFSGGLKLSGDLYNYASEFDMYPDSSHIYINGQHIFKIGGLSNYGSGVSIKECPDGRCHFKLEFFGDHDSHVTWPVGLPIDTLVVNKANCGKVTFKNSVYISGEARIQSGQLSLTQNDGIPYKLVCVGDLNIAKDGGVLLRRDSTGAVANIAVNGTIRDFNTVVDSTCTGFNNPYHGRLTLYKTTSGSNNGIAIETAANIGDLELIGDGVSNFALGGNLEVNNFRFINTGKLVLGDHNLTVNGSLVNFGAQNYFVTNGAGKLQLNNVGSSETTFPVGPSTTSYNPLFITNSGTIDGFRVRVQPTVLSNGDTGNPYVGGAVDRTWNVEEVTPGGSNATVKLQWNAADELAGFARNTAYLSHYTAGSWNKGNLMAAEGTEPYTLTRNTITSFSPFAVLGPTTTLPLQLIYFGAKPTPQGTALQWTTETEHGIKSFTVERSSNRIVYSALATMPASNQSGSRKNYFFTDDSFSDNLNYYRLKITEVDGSYTYTEVVAVTTADRNNFLLYPNPAKDKLIVRLNDLSGEIVLQVIDQNGMHVITQKTKTGLSIATIDVSGLKAGVYSLVIDTGNEKHTLKFVKQ